MSKLEKQKEKARNLEAKDPKGAIEAWQQVLKGQEEEGDPNPDLAIFNRIGDLHLKVRDPAQAADYYDQAVDKYAELGFHNNAIAMCNKVLRNAPGRQNTYLKLAKLYASKGFMAEAKQNFVDYAERMHKIGKIQQAFAAPKAHTCAKRWRSTSGCMVIRSGARPGRRRRRRLRPQTTHRSRVSERRRVWCSSTWMPLPLAGGRGR